MNRKDLRFTKTEKLIREAFFKSVDRNGFEKTTVSEICAIAEISRHAFYSHYEDKYRLLAKLLEELEEDLMGSMGSDVLSRARMGDFYPSAQRCVSDITENRDMIRDLIKCDRRQVTSILKRIYMDLPTSLYISDYEKKIESTENRLSRAYISNALIGFFEEVLSMESEIDRDELLRVFYNLSDYVSRYFIRQLQK